jgi:crotonobetainyl-CoA:carnitine CoA-transferase CaiB-like acyl-CoA transferase
MKIIDLSCDVSGRFAAKLFALSGLEVIRPRAERPAQQFERDLEQYLDGDKTATTVADLAAAARLIADADLVFTTFDRGGWRGLAAEVELDPASVQVTTSTFGVSGRYAAWRGGPLADWAAGGYFAITGNPDREPLIGPERLCGYVGGYTAATAAEAALEMRRLTGVGQHVDVSTMEAMLCVHQSTFARVAAGVGRPRTGRYTEVYPLVVRPCLDGHVSLGVVTDAEFDRLAVALDRSELALDSRFSDVGARWTNRGALEHELDQILRHLSCDEVVTRLHAFGLASAKVADALEVTRNPQLAHRGYWRSGADGGLEPGDPIPSPRTFLAAGEPDGGALRSWAEARSARPGLPLAGTVVLDLTAFWAGPSATRNLADLGATVIKIERPGSRADLEDRVEDPAMLVEHLFHCKMNRHKLSVALDVAEPQGASLLRRLALWADVLVENFRPGVAGRLGLGAPELCSANPDLVYVSLSGFGADGPWGELRSYGPTIEAASSIAARTGYPGGEPLRLGHTLPDGVGGLAGTLTVLRGLRERRSHGCGGWRNVSQLEVYVALSGEEILTASRLGHAQERIGNRSRTGAVQGAFPCHGDDEWIAIRLQDAADAAKLAAHCGLPALSALFATSPRDDARIEAMIAAATRDHEKHDLARRLQEAGLEAVPVFKPEELIADAHLHERGFFVSADAAGRACLLPGSPFRGRTPLSDPRGPAPRFGEHTEELLQLLAARARHRP